MTEYFSKKCNQTSQKYVQYKHQYKACKLDMAYSEMMTADYYF